MAAGTRPSDIRLDSPFSVGGLTIPNRILLAPMSGVTDLPFRRRAISAGIGLAPAEMVASGELQRDRAESLRRIKGQGSALRAVQLVGRDAETMGIAARRLADEGIQIIDINMGCPAKKVTGGACGAALMTEPDRALRIVEHVRFSAGTAQVSVKMRLGWNHDQLNAAALARRFADAGVSMITVHGRTREQRYAGRADIDAIAGVRQAVPEIAFVANGDVTSRCEALRMLHRTGADAVMIGRAHYGQPYLAAHLLENGLAPGPSILFDYIAEHYEDMLIEYGSQRGRRHARKHLGWYLDRLRPHTDAALRQSILTAQEPEETLARLAEAFASTPMEEAA
ncbi:tRNA dihydrouridine synthase [Notoacmeibacter ruber]|uniref:tRNA-dihydrouridine synthase n=1 Tax=Notoacmeibacter ruber TaxID=2670375 RepID=A0A3L7JBW9_9HYPH|nr:tRNA-dihydrouridine synthase [Notoacmeibacter ruber]RLQ87875.1 tRNA-dihydrouridine synthase [Notoacmeibacter ruber]